METPFFWYCVNGDGTADILPETPELVAQINSGARNIFGSPEGAILNGGVMACAFRRKVERTYDARAAILRGERIAAGWRETITVTACPPGIEFPPHIVRDHPDNFLPEAETFFD